MRKASTLPTIRSSCDRTTRASIVREIATWRLNDSSRCIEIYTHQEDGACQRAATRGIRNNNVETLNTVSTTRVHRDTTIFKRLFDIYKCIERKRERKRERERFGSDGCISHEWYSRLTISSHLDRCHLLIQNRRRPFRVQFVRIFPSKCIQPSS